MSRASSAPAAPAEAATCAQARWCRPALGDRRVQDRRARRGDPALCGARWPVHSPARVVSARLSRQLQTGSSLATLPQLPQLRAARAATSAQIAAQHPTPGPTRTSRARTTAVRPSTKPSARRCRLATPDCRRVTLAGTRSQSRLLVSGRLVRARHRAVIGSRPGLGRRAAPRLVVGPRQTLNRAHVKSPR